ncbi:hypothetical protein GCM10027194_20050 [Thalassiella azotivora]
MVLALALSVVLAALVAPGRAVATPLAEPGVHVDPAASPLPPVPAAAWLVADADTGDVLASYGAHDPLAPASTLKVLTAMALVPRIDPQARYTARFEDAAVDGSKVGLVEGSTYSVDDLVHGLLLGSGNDTATALAELAGGQEPAVRRMQEVAEAAGATSTVVRNTSGLDHPEQVTTAHDLAVVGRAALEQEWLVEVMTTPRYAFPGAGVAGDPSRPTYEVGNHNRLLGGYEGTLGLKNGYTELARGSFLGAARRDSRTYVVAVLRVEGPSWRPARDLLDWAFANPAAEPVGRLATGPAPGEDGVSAEGGGIAGTGASTQARAAAGVDDGSGLPWPVRALLTALALLAAAVVLLRARVLVRRRLRSRRRSASRSTGPRSRTAPPAGRREPVSPRSADRP